MQEETDLFGIPVPSTDKVFLSIAIVHILVSIGAVICGAVAMFVLKGSVRHNKWGLAYFCLMMISFTTVTILSAMRWPHNIHLLAIGMLAAGFTYTGRRTTKSKPSRWTSLHAICMAASYILLLTGFYVDNGKNLPFWNLFPQWFFYVFPSMIGIPILVRVLMTHPLTRHSK